jgi:hypothetical protein
MGCQAFEIRIWLRTTACNITTSSTTSTTPSCCAKVDRLYERSLSSGHARSQARAHCSANRTCARITTRSGAASATARSHPAGSANRCHTDVVRAGRCHQGSYTTSEHGTTTYATAAASAKQHRWYDRTSSSAIFFRTYGPRTERIRSSCTAPAPADWLQP